MYFQETFHAGWHSLSLCSVFLFVLGGLFSLNCSQEEVARLASPAWCLWGSLGAHPTILLTLWLENMAQQKGGSSLNPGREGNLKAPQVLTQFCPEAITLLGLRAPPAVSPRRGRSLGFSVALHGGLHSQRPPPVIVHVEITDPEMLSLCFHLQLKVCGIQSALLIRTSFLLNGSKPIGLAFGALLSMSWPVFGHVPLFC